MKRTSTLSASAGGSSGAGSADGLLEGGRDDLSREVKELAEVVNALGGEDVLQTGTCQLSDCGANSSIRRT